VFLPQLRLLHPLCRACFLSLLVLLLLQFQELQNLPLIYEKKQCAYPCLLAQVVQGRRFQPNLRAHHLLLQHRLQNQSHLERVQLGSFKNPEFRPSPLQLLRPAQAELL
jgi:hypothetical protein